MTETGASGVYATRDAVERPAPEGEPMFNEDEEWFLALTRERQGQIRRWIDKKSLVLGPDPTTDPAQLTIEDALG